MAVYKQKGSDNWSYRFRWRNEEVRVSTKQTNKRVAEQMEAAHKTRLAKGEVGITQRKPIPTLAQFAETDFRPYIVAQFTAQRKTAEYYGNGLRAILGYPVLATCPLDRITAEMIAGFIAKRRDAGLMISSINRELQVLRRMFNLALEWGKVERAFPKVRMLPGERRRERVLQPDEEARYFVEAGTLGTCLEDAYRDALGGIRCIMRGQQPIQPDAFLMRDVATVLMDCGLRPEECFRLRWEYVRDGALEIPWGKTANARRRIPLSPRTAAILEMRRTARRSEEWVFPAPTMSGHIESSSVDGQHGKVCKAAKLERFHLYTFRHTCLTRWAAHMDPYTLAYLAGHSDFATTRRYVHPQQDTVLKAMEKAREAQGGHNSGHSAKVATEEKTSRKTN